MKPFSLLSVVTILSAIRSAISAALPPQPTQPPNPLDRRGVVGFLTSSLPAEVTSYLGSLPSDVLQGVLPAFEGLPDGDTIKNKLNISDEELANEPLKILNIP